MRLRCEITRKDQGCFSLDKIHGNNNDIGAGSFPGMFSRCSSPRNSYAPTLRGKIDYFFLNPKMWTALAALP